MDKSINDKKESNNLCDEKIKESYLLILILNKKNI